MMLACLPRCLRSQTRGLPACCPCQMRAWMDLRIIAYSIELPADVDSEVMGSARSMSSTMTLQLGDCSDEDQDEGVLLPPVGPPECRPVPSPDAFAEFLRACSQEFVAEYYSPPRVLPRCRAQGPELPGNFNISLDILNGWDFSVRRNRLLSLRLLQDLSIKCLILSPPCTVFSELQRLFNIKKMKKEAWAAKFHAGMVLLEHSMLCCHEQIRKGAIFIFEHPARASSWEQDCVRLLSERTDVFTVRFDQCMLGLVSKVHGRPMKKRTQIMTNSRQIAESFRPFQCSRDHEHQEIMGAEGGMSRSRWAQIYPPPMVAHLCDCVYRHC